MSRGIRLALPLGVLGLVMAAEAIVLRLPADTGADGGLPPWAALLWPYAGLALLAVGLLWRSGQLRELLRFRPGDPSLGIGVAIVLLLLAWLLGAALIPPTSVLHAWVLRVFVVAGDSSGWGALGCLLGLALCEELVWRGLVQSALDASLGARRGWIAAAVLYACAQGPTLFTLADDAAGPNPLLVLLALGAGTCWGFSRARTGRLMPAVLSHAAFAYLATQFLDRFL